MNKKRVDQIIDFITNLLKKLTLNRGSLCQNVDLNIAELKKKVNSKYISF